MAIVINNGQQVYEGEEFVSTSVYNAYIGDKSWDSENYVWVELGSIFPAWITQSEKEELSKFTDLDEISRFAINLNLLAIPKDDFDKWKQGQS